MFELQGTHQIDVDSKAQGTHCGLLPIGQPCNHVTTTGLKWNVCESSLYNICFVVSLFYW